MFLSLLSRQFISTLTGFDVAHAHKYFLFQFRSAVTTLLFCVCWDTLQCGRLSRNVFWQLRPHFSTCRCRPS